MSKIHSFPRCKASTHKSFTKVSPGTDTCYCASDLVQPNILQVIKFSSSNLKPELQEVLTEFGGQKNASETASCIIVLVILSHVSNHFCQPPFSIHRRLIHWLIWGPLTGALTWLPTYPPKHNTTQNPKKHPSTHFVTAVQTSSRSPTGLPKDEDWATRLGMKYPDVTDKNDINIHLLYIVSLRMATPWVNTENISVGWFQHHKWRTRRDSVVLLLNVHPKIPKQPLFPHMEVS